MSIFKKRQRQVVHVLKLDANTEKFVELMSLSNEERRKRALELLGDKWLDTLIFADAPGSGLSLNRPPTDPSGASTVGINSIVFGEDHIGKLMKLAFPYKEYTIKLREELAKKPLPDPGLDVFL